MVDRASKLAISDDNASEDAGDEWDAVWSISSTGVSEVFLVKANGLKVIPHLAAIMPDLKDDHGFPRWF